MSHCRTKCAGAGSWTVHSLTSPDLLLLLVLTGHLHYPKTTKYKLNCFCVPVPERPLTLNIIPNVTDTNKLIHTRWMIELGLQTLHHPVHKSSQWLMPISSISLFPICSSFPFNSDLLRVCQPCTAKINVLQWNRNLRFFNSSPWYLYLMPRLYHP